MNALFIYVIIHISTTMSTQVSYRNFSLYQVQPIRSKDVKFFRGAFKNNTFGWMFWTEHIMLDWPISILVAPKGRKAFEATLERQNIAFKRTIDDLERELSEQKAVKHDRRKMESFDWSDYYTLDSINDWLTDIQKLYANVSSIVDGGKTHENRTIRGIRIANKLDTMMPIVVVEAGIHAREWISVSVATYIIKQLLEIKTTETKLARKRYEFYIFPTLNPDGYFYTHTKDRMWRKNRKPYPPGIGVDLNRNFDIDWMVTGSSSVKKLETYAGPQAFSEPETRTYSTTLQTLGNRIHLYISLHCYGQLLLIPPIYTSVPDKHFARSEIMGMKAAAVLAKYGTKYKVGTAANILYKVSGNSVDWVKIKMNTPHAFVYELRDLGQYGFALPKQQILPTCIETTDSIMSLINYARETKRAGMEVRFPAGNRIENVTPLATSYIITVLILFIV